eukprot:8509905-Pyramimonas_sp.AAC.1
MDARKARCHRQDSSLVRTILVPIEKEQVKRKKILERREEGFSCLPQPEMRREGRVLLTGLTDSAE